MDIRASPFILLLQLELALEARLDLGFGAGKLSLQPLDLVLVVLILLFLSTVAADEGLSQHLDLLNHSVLFKTLQIVRVLDQAALVLCCDLCQQLLHQVFLFQALSCLVLSRFLCGGFFAGSFGGRLGCEDSSFQDDVPHAFLLDRLQLRQTHRGVVGCVGSQCRRLSSRVCIRGRFSQFMGVTGAVRGARSRP